MSMSTPLDSARWGFIQPRWAGKDLPTVAGFGGAFEKDNFAAHMTSSASNKDILEKQAWNVAMAPGKSIFMNVFMIWMMGSGSGIFSILMVGYAVMNSFSSLVRVNAAFTIFQGKVNVLLQKALYVFINLAVLWYLCNHAANMGLFPINSGDWVASFPNSEIPERAVRIL